MQRFGGRHSGAMLRLVHTIISVACLWAICSPKASSQQPPMPVPPPHPRPTQPLDVRERPWNDPRFYYVPQTVFVDVSVPPRTEVTLYAPDGRAVTMDKSILAGMQSRGVYAFSIRAGDGSQRREYHGTIDVIRGPMIPPDLAPADATIPVIFDEEDLIQITRGRMVTKILVLEDPATALDYPSRTDVPIRYDMSFDENPIKRAKELGKIMMVVRVGNRERTADELAGFSKAGSLMIGKVIELVDADGNRRVSKPEFVLAEEYPRGAVQQVAWDCPNGACGGRGANGGCANGACPGGAPPNGACADGACAGPRGPQGLTDFRNIINNDLTNNYEYLCDGGDRRPRIGWVTGGQIVNINPEDTIAEYQLSDGGKRFSISNRVCIFAPRYVEVRTVRMLEGFEVTDGYKTVSQDLNPRWMIGEHPDAMKVGQTSAGLLRTELRPKGLASAEGTDALLEVRILAGYEQGIGWASISGWFRHQELTGVIAPVLKKRIEFAATLTAVQMPQIVAMTAGTGEIFTYWDTHELRRIDLRSPNPGVLLLEKSADKDHAEVGEIVTFAIRYTNKGGQPVSNITVVDSLTARLEYVPESANSERKAVFTTTSNEVGSQTLRWEIPETLEPGDSGMVNFKARIR